MQNGNPKATKVFVGLSGGVDSAVSAALLRQQGYQVTGVFMKNWSGDNYGLQEDCPWEEDQKNAQAVADHLGIAFRSFNFEKQYREKVLDYFFTEYEAGRTPNPDVMCNKEIKFRLFLDKAIQEGADMIATGHYAQVQENNGVYSMWRGVDHNKDQTYFLYTLGQEQLQKTLFPIGHLHKPEVRKLAHEFKLPNANRPDSQGICFIGDIDVQEYLRKNISTQPGDIVDIDTKAVVGKHDGVYFYTNGQRQGLGIGGQAVPYFVVGKDAHKNILYVGHGHDHPELNKTKVKLENLHIIEAHLPADAQLTASSRYRQPPQPGVIDQEKLLFEYNRPQRALTPGQSLVLYAGERCLGGGNIS